MYNEYLQDFQESEYSSEQKQSSSNLLQLLSGHLNTVKLNTDTLIAIAVVWFLLSDGKALDTDLLIVIGVLLLLGL